MQTQGTARLSGSSSASMPTTQLATLVIVNGRTTPCGCLRRTSRWAGAFCGTLATPSLGSSIVFLSRGADHCCSLASSPSPEASPSLDPAPPSPPAGSLSGDVIWLSPDSSPSPQASPSPTSESDDAISRRAGRTLTLADAARNQRTSRRPGSMMPSAMSIEQQ